MKRLCTIIAFLVFLVSCSHSPVDAKLELTLMTDDSYTLEVNEKAVACVYIKHGSSDIEADMLDIRSGDTVVALASLQELTESGYAYIEITALSGGETDVSVAGGNSSLISIHVTVRPSESETVRPSESETVRPSESETVRPSESETVRPSESETARPSESDTARPSESESGSSSNNSSIEVISFTYTVKRGNDATLKIVGRAGHSYSITVEMKSGYSTAAGLEQKTADDNGYVEWTWRVGGKSSTDFQPIVTVKDIDSGENLILKYTVTK